MSKQSSAPQYHIWNTSVEKLATGEAKLCLGHGAPVRIEHLNGAQKCPECRDGGE